MIEKMFKRNLTQGYFVPASVLSMYEEGGELKYQEGGQSEDPMQQIMMMAMEAVKNQDGEMALQVCTILLEEMGMGGEENQEPSPQTKDEEVPMGRRGMEIYDDNQELLY